MRKRLSANLVAIILPPGDFVNERSVRQWKL